ncbi:hypothetical protein CROQUDRAFT_107727 [Cronartium quercuum f. sp. fusiforme G11]|uniref:Uncharacterized protein n=1 Tax=Cronartium quercuum f. sp. fusiforme G11 TaxID=708437 RepID=A0A9P6TAU5_9BASI|nr:hypothetical protein CROQUDRAFT_107727 [Cronartium quercuum f. sp. fusiforme G11]
MEVLLIQNKLNQCPRPSSKYSVEVGGLIALFVCTGPAARSFVVPGLGYASTGSARKPIERR